MFWIYFNKFLPCSASKTIKRHLALILLCLPAKKANIKWFQFGIKKLSVGVFSLTLGRVCCGYTAFRPIALCELVFAFKVACRNMWVLQSLCSSVALVLRPSNIFLWLRPRKVSSKGFRLPFQVRVSVPFLENHFSNLLTDFWSRFHSLPKLFNYILLLL